MQSNLKTRAAPEEAKSVSVPTAPSQGNTPWRPGDTLSYLALKYYGDQYKWEKIYEANKQAMKSPHSLYVGQKIIIPLLDGKLFGDQTLPVFGPSPEYNLEKSSAGATIISDVSEPR